MIDTSMKDLVLGIDIGGTNLRGALVGRDGVLSRRSDTKSGAEAGISSVIENLLEFISEYEKYGPSAISVGIPGIVDSKRGILTQAPNINDVDNFPFVKTLNESLGYREIPLYIDNDANCAAVGEFWAGAGKGCESMIMMTLGTGLGGGLIFKGRLWRGSDGMAGEIGHMVVDPGGPLCSCGSRGCLESFVSSKALFRIVNENDILNPFFNTLSYDDVPYELMKRAREGDTEAIAIWEDFGTYLGIGITSLVNLLNVEMIVVGGGISNSWDLFIKKAREELTSRGLKAPAERVEIRKALLGDDAGIAGSALIAFRRLKGDAEF